MQPTTPLQKAFLTIQKQKKLLAKSHTKSFEPIAIVGLSCRFPEANNKNEFWQLLSSGKNIISEYPEERWDLLANTQESILRDRNHVYWGGFLEKITAFDAYFFGISPREAIRMDPQQRLLLEVAYEAIEDAGIPLEVLAGSNTGVFSSLYSSQFGYMQKLDSELDALYLPTGNASSIAANRLSYIFDLRGPSIVLDTACSSSLVALHTAVLNLQNKLCDAALVCAVNINLLPSINLILAKAKMLSPDGQCKTFDASANGYVPGEGVGVIVLKPLANALKNKDRIYAVINGSAVNQDGKTNGLTAPNGLQQEALLKSAYATANINPHTISYIECHGTGTFLGDPIEIEALGKVVGQNRQKDQPCWIGSVKTNIGHLEPAAGIASIIKVALGLYNKKIPAHLNCQTHNPHIQFEKNNLRIPTAQQDWPKYEECRLAGISGFGFGGTNAHVILRDLSKDEEIKYSEIPIKQFEIFTLSAKDRNALNILIEDWCRFLENNTEITLAQICYNLHLRRSHYTEKLVVIAENNAELLRMLRDILHSKNPEKLYAINCNRDSETYDIARRYVNSEIINWQEYESKRSFMQIDMPLYPWQHKEYWPILDNKLEQTDSYPLQGKRIYSPLPTVQFEFKFDTRKMPEIQDTYNVLHAGYYVEMLAYAVKNLSKQLKFCIEDLKFISALLVPNNTIVTVHLLLDRQENGDFTFLFHGKGENTENWIEHAKGQLSINDLITPQLEQIDVIRQRHTEAILAENLYKKVIDMGMPAGDSIRWTKQFWLGKDEILCEFLQPKSIQNNSIFTLKIHPGVIDGCIQPIFKILSDDFTKPYMATHIKKINYFGYNEGTLYLLGILKNINNTRENILCDCYLINENNKIIVELKNINLTQLSSNIQLEKFINSEHQAIDLNLLDAKERKIYITDFLIEHIASIFVLPKEDIKLNLSLRELGIDSLTALALSRMIEMGLGYACTTQILVEDQTISDLINLIDSHFTHHTLDQSEFKPIFKPEKWISYRQKQVSAEIRLFCFPYGGGGASIYHEWQHGVARSIEICPIQLPGREERMDESPITNIKILLDNLLENIQGEMDLPFAFFGHSFGALIAFEFTRLLRRRGLTMPVHLFVSAFPDPRLPMKNLDILLDELNTININLSKAESVHYVDQLTDEQIIRVSETFKRNGITEYGDHLLNREILKIMLPIFVSDMRVIKSYQYSDEAPFDLPITVFIGKQDRWVSYEDHLKWLDHTQKKCEMHIFDSGHLFIREADIKKDVLHKIAHALITSDVVKV